MNLNVSFSKLGYMGINAVLDDYGVNYSKHTIFQSSNLKEKLEKCNLKCDEVIVMSLDIVSMYPLVRFELIQNALQHCTKNLPAEAQETIEQCMDIVQFRMKSMLIQF
eukprot:5958216-Ditylum_brightwellii.AAC.1